MPSTSTFFFEDTVFVSDATTQADIFTDVSGRLLTAGYVAPAFLENVIEREENYPTGLDMSPVDPELPNFAIPHTEPEFAKTCRIVPVKLIHPVEWHSMTDPSQTITVSFLFMILNDDAQAQVGILAKIMDFVNTLGASRVKQLFSMTDPHRIYEFLVQNFPAE